MSYTKPNPAKSFLLLCFLMLTVFGCRKNTAKPEYPAGTDEYINSWVLDSMRVYYYWNTGLPAKPEFNRAPLDFFYGIRNTNDRFSRLVNPGVPESYYPSLVHNFGFDLAVYQNSSGVVKTVVTLVVPGAEAANSGLTRGAVLTSINGKAIDADRISGLIQTSIQQRKIILEVEGKGTLILGAAFITENPVYNYQVLESGGKKIAYLFLNAFEGRAKFDLERAFSAFRQQHATELILDLRYNPGGDIGMAAAMAAMIANVGPKDTFIEYRGNKNAGIRKSSFEQSLAGMAAGYTISFEEAAAQRLPLNRVFILTGAHTASASEFLVQGLKPWITVVQVGGKTLGKDMASFVIQDHSSPSKVNNWSIEPLIFKLYNSQGAGDYAGGLTPDLSSDEFSTSLKPFGDVSDPLIRTAIARITGIQLPLVNSLRMEATATKLLFDSRDAMDQLAGPIRVSRGL